MRGRIRFGYTHKGGRISVFTHRGGENTVDSSYMRGGIRLVAHRTWGRIVWVTNKGGGDKVIYT